MNSRSWILATCCTGALGFLSGCGDDRDRTVIIHHEERDAPREVVVVESRPERTVVIQRDDPDVVVVRERPKPTVIVRANPPRVIVEKRPPPPSGRHAWISGHWSRDGDKWVWVRGHYAKARPGYRHVDARWKKSGDGWVLEGGYWRR